MTNDQAPQPTPAPPASNPGERSFIRRNLPFVLFLILAFAVRWSILDQYVVPSGSMEQTIQVGDHILVNKMAYDLKFPYTSWVLAHLDSPKRGDIVVFENPKDGVTMVKRIMGLPGEHMVIDDGFVTINGQPIDGDVQGETLLRNATSEEPISYQDHIEGKTVNIQRLPYMVRPKHTDLVIPPDEYFGMGDNRDNSSDSRFWGTIPRHLLKGHAFAIFWSGKLENWVPSLKPERTGQALN